MGLETFDFIPDLVDTNPTPTDPVAQGDDHLRGIKFTLQNQFPVIGENAVDLTALQINKAAIQDEANLFTVQQTFQQDVIRTVQGSNESGLYFNNSETTFRRWAFGRENTDASGDWIVQRRDTAGAVQDTPLRLSQADGNATFSGRILGQGGTAALPAFSFSGDAAKGMFSPDLDQIGFAVAGVESFRISASVVSLRGNTTQLRVQDGTALVPSISFVDGDTDTGMYRAASNVLGFTTAGIVRATITAAGIRSNIAGTVGGPSYSFNDDADTGMFVTLPNLLGFAAGGQQAMQLKNAVSQVNMVRLPTGPGGGLVSGDLYVKSSGEYFPNDLLVGMEP